jgi:hypothetical protein
MTAPECLSARPVAMQPSRRRAPARRAKVCLNSDGGPHDAHTKMQNKPISHPGTGGRDTRTVAPCPCSPRQAILRSLKSHS